MVQRSTRLIEFLAHLCDQEIKISFKIAKSSKGIKISCLKALGNLHKTYFEFPTIKLGLLWTCTMVIVPTKIQTKNLGFFMSLERLSHSKGDSFYQNCDLIIKTH